MTPAIEPDEPWVQEENARFAEQLHLAALIRAALAHPEQRTNTEAVVLAMRSLGPDANPVLLWSFSAQQGRQLKAQISAMWRDRAANHEGPL